MKPIDAFCIRCGTKARLEKWTTFSYFYCTSCKDEVDVRLSTITSAKGEIYGYQNKTDNEIELTAEGIYYLEYFDGTYEYFKRWGTDAQKPTRLNRDLVRSATRLTERDLPHRKSVQSLSEASQGTSSQGQSLRIDADASYSVSGYNPVQNYVDSGAIITIDSAQDDFDPFCPHTNDGYSASSGVSNSFTDALQKLGYDSKCVQYGQMLPEDQL